MVLTGDGGDEVLSGYVKYQGLKFAQQYHQLPGVVRSSLPQVLDFLSRPVNGRLGSSLRRVRDVFRYSNMDPEQRFLMKLACTEYGVIKPLVNNTSTMKFEDFYHDFMRKCPYQDQFYRLMYYDLKLKLPDDMLVKVDRMSMAHSLETRIPFLDHRIVELLASVDKNVKMQGYERKSILRRSLGRRLPKPLLSAGKKGFAVPLRDWFKQDSFEDQLGSLSRSDFGLDRTTIEGIIERNRTGIEDNGNFIWMLFVLKEWLLN
jgi:asparagine synthase (glutamine-hydrolysing)